jgi:hypothetical protein
MTVDIRKQLESHQAELIAKIASAANASDPAGVLSLNEELRQTVSLLNRLNEMYVEARAMLGRAERANSQLIPTPPTPYSAVATGRGRGAQIRSAFLNRANDAGLKLRPYRGTVFSSPNGRRIGIAVATERNPNRWFLGLGESDFDAAVLLCAQNSGKVLDICLPTSFIAMYREHFSRSGGQDSWPYPSARRPVCRINRWC